jgi:pimeloyl-ACP methyl ester carboxylesterase
VTDYRWAGAAEGPVLVVGNSLGTTSAMWREQMPALGRTMRLLLIDHPGHDDAAAPTADRSDGERHAARTPTAGSADEPGGEDLPHSIDQLGRRALRILDQAGVERAHYLGLSLGGMVGMWLAANAPERVDRLAVCCTTAYFGTPEPWRQCGPTAWRRSRRRWWRAGSGRATTGPG